MLFWYLLVLGIVLLWSFVAYVIYKSKYKDPLDKRGIAFQGPFILWKTKKGRDFIDRISKRKKACSFYGWLSVGISAATMVTMTCMLIFMAGLIITLEKRVVIEPHLLLGLPGLNPIIPLWYGIFGLVVAIIVHEFSHGILARLAKVKIKSLGLVFFIVPMGAFVEPDEEELKALDRRSRIRMYAAGPASNMMVAFVCAVLFSVVLMGGVQAAHDGGIGITDVEEGSPADIANIQAGMIMVSFDGVTIDDYGDFSNAIFNTRENQTVIIGLFQKDSGYLNISANLSNRAIETGLHTDTGKGYLGVYTITITTGYFYPFRGADEQGGLLRSMIDYVTLPIQRLSPVSSPTTDFYEITGFWSNIPESTFWIISNALYWVFWLNLMVGLTNALPAVPLDGGYIYRDWLDMYYEKRLSKKERAEARTLWLKLRRSSNAGTIEQKEVKNIYKQKMKTLIEKNKTKREKVVDYITITTAFAILFLILWQIIGPRIM